MNNIIYFIKIMFIFISVSTWLIVWTLCVLKTIGRTQSIGWHTIIYHSRMISQDGFVSWHATQPYFYQQVRIIFVANESLLCSVDNLCLHVQCAMCLSLDHTCVTHTEVCCMQIVKTGLCSVLLRVFDRWDRYEGRMRLKICAHILQTLQHLCNISTYLF